MVVPNVGAYKDSTCEVSSEFTLRLFVNYLFTAAADRGAKAQEEDDAGNGAGE